MIGEHIMLTRRALNSKNAKNQASTHSSANRDAASSSTVRYKNEPFPAEGTTPWLRAAANGQLKTLERIAESIAKDELNECDHAGNTALLLAAYNGHVNSVDFLLTNKLAKITETNNAGDNVLTMAALGGRDTIFTYFENQGEHYLLNLLQQRNVFGHSILSAALTLPNNPCINTVLSVQKYATQHDLMLAILHNQPFSVINRLVNAVAHLKGFKNIFELLKENGYLPSSVCQYKTFNVGIFGSSAELNQRFLKQLFDNTPARIYPQAVLQHRETSLDEYNLHPLLKKVLQDNRRNMIDQGIERNIGTKNGKSHSSLTSEPHLTTNFDQQLGVFQTNQETLLPLLFHYNTQDMDLGATQEWPNIDFDIIMVRFNPSDTVEKINRIKEKLKSTYSNKLMILFNDQTNSKPSILNEIVRLCFENESKKMHERDVNRSTARNIINHVGDLIPLNKQNSTIEVVFPAVIAQGELRNYITGSKLPKTHTTKKDSLSGQLYDSYCNVESLLRSGKSEMALGSLVRNLNNIVCFHRLPINWVKIINEKNKMNIKINTFVFSDFLMAFSGLLNRSTSRSAFEQIQFILIETTRRYVSQLIKDKQYHSALDALKEALQELNGNKDFSNRFDFETVTRLFCYDTELITLLITLCCYIMRKQELSHSELSQIKNMLTEFDKNRHYYPHINTALNRLSQIDKSFNGSDNELAALMLNYYNLSDIAKNTGNTHRSESSESSSERTDSGLLVLNMRRSSSSSSSSETATDETATSSDDVLVDNLYGVSRHNAASFESISLLSSSSSDEAFNLRLLTHSQSLPGLNRKQSRSFERDNGAKQGKGKGPASLASSNPPLRTTFFAKESDPSKNGVDITRSKAESSSAVNKTAGSYSGK